PVFVVADRGDEGHDETPAAACVALFGAEIKVLPEDATVLFVQADRVRDHMRRAIDAVDHRVEVMDHAQTVAAQRQAVGERADAVVAAIEGILARMHALRAAIGHHHLRKAGSLAHRAPAILASDGEYWHDTPLSLR